MLRTAKTTGILLTALLLEFYSFVFYLSYFENSYVTWVIFGKQLFLVLFMYVIAFVACISAYIYASCLLSWVIVSSAYWAKLPSVWRCLTFYGPSAQRFLPSVLLELSDGMRRFCDPFRALSSSLCGTCYFLYARWHWVFEGPVSFDETVGILASGHQGLSRTYHFGKPVGF